MTNRAVSSLVREGLSDDGAKENFNNTIARPGLNKLRRETEAKQREPI